MNKYPPVFKRIILMKRHQMIYALLLALVTVLAPRTQVSAAGNITSFVSTEPVIRYDGYVEAPSVMITVEWDLNNPPEGYSVAFVQIELTGHMKELVRGTSENTYGYPDLAANQAYLDVCVGGADCEYNNQISLRMYLLDAHSVVVDSRDLSIPIEHYSMAASYYEKPDTAIAWAGSQVITVIWVIRILVSFLLR